MTGDFPRFPLTQHGDFPLSLSLSLDLISLSAAYRFSSAAMMVCFGSDDDDGGCVVNS